MSGDTAGEETGRRERLLAGAASLNAPLTAAAADSLLEYLRLLETWNSRFNLSGLRDLDEMVPLHLLDSLSVAPWLGGTGARTVVDVGSGAGLPGIPLSLLFPETRFVLSESNGKKIRFLFQAKLNLSLDNVSLAHGRIEDYTGPADVLICRAFAPLAQCCAKTRHLLARGATLLAMQGRYPAAAIARLPEGCVVESSHRVRVPGASNRHLLALRWRT